MELLTLLFFFFFLHFAFFLFVFHYTLCHGHLSMWSHLDQAVEHLQSILACGWPIIYLRILLLMGTETAPFFPIFPLRTAVNLLVLAHSGQYFCRRNS